ncbi:MAG: PEGA domain-containing protein, partial [Kofleriaceae bacterium]
GAVTVVGAAMAVFLVVHSETERSVEAASAPTGNAVAVDPAVTSSGPVDATPALLGAPSDAAALVVGLDAGAVAAIKNDEPESPAAPSPPATDAGVPSESSKPRTSEARPAAPVGRGQLLILVSPWAAVWIDGKLWGQTPFRESVPAGKHRLKLVHEDSGRTERTTITIKAGETLKIERDWK